MRKREKTALILNLVIVVLELWVMNNTFFGILGEAQWGRMFRFFTEDSNAILGISSLLMAIFQIRHLRNGKAIPKGIVRFHFIGTAGVLTTFFVVLFFLLPVTAIQYGIWYAMWSFPNMFFTHLTCPILAFLSFTVFEAELPLRKRDSLFSLIEVCTYATVIGTFATLHLFSIENIYGFMDFYSHPWWMEMLAILLIVGGTELVSFLDLLLREKIGIRDSKKAKKKS
jgi:hypothetical protein